MLEPGGEKRGPIFEGVNLDWFRGLWKGEVRRDTFIMSCSGVVTGPKTPMDPQSFVIALRIIPGTSVHMYVHNYVKKSTSNYSPKPQHGGIHSRTPYS